MVRTIGLRERSGAEMAAWGRSGAIAFETAALGEHVTRRPWQAIAGPTEDRTIGNETI